MKVLQINTTVNSGSTGRIAENIGEVLIANGHQSYIAYGRGSQSSQSHKIQIGTSLDWQLHGLKTRLFDRHGFGSAAATKKFIQQLKEIKPDIIHLHNIHGYYIHVGLLFSYLKETKTPVLWTLHDCWPFTGHCSYFDFVQCDKWKTHCHQCPLSKRYPESLFIDNSKGNFDDKKALFTGVENLKIVTPSHWLKNLLAASFLHQYPVTVIHNGVSMEVFKPAGENIAALKQKLGIADEFIILGVASIWDRRKGLADFITLSKKISADKKIILVGLSKELSKDLPANIIAIERTENIQELVTLYNLADVFVNPTLVDNFPTTNIEALACGTPVVTYNTGGSIEAVDSSTGFVVEKNDVIGLQKVIEEVQAKSKNHFTVQCRKRAVSFFNNEDRYTDYLKLYKTFG
jgi:putative colanic acid biosynthesis glycosyltransferase